MSSKEYADKLKDPRCENCKYSLGYLGGEKLEKVIYRECRYNPPNVTAIPTMKDSRGVGIIHDFQTSFPYIEPHWYCSKFEVKSE
jgi:hypothetical protein